MSKPEYSGKNQNSHRELCVCANCAGRLVQPVTSSEVSVGQWQILLRCPDCEHEEEGTFPQYPQVEQFDNELEREYDSLVKDLKHITHSNMSGELKIFISALSRDLITADDFEVLT